MAAGWWSPSRAWEEQKTAYEISLGLVGSEMCIRDRLCSRHCCKNLRVSQNPEWVEWVAGLQTRRQRKSTRVVYRSWVLQTQALTHGHKSRSSEVLIDALRSHCQRHCVEAQHPFVAMQGLYKNAFCDQLRMTARNHMIVWTHGCLSCKYIQFDETNGAFRMLTRILTVLMSSSCCMCTRCRLFKHKRAHPPECAVETG